MTILVQHKVGETALNQATVAITVASTGAGNLGVVGAMNTGTLTVSGVADNAAGGTSTYTQVPGATFSGTANDKGDVWVCTSLKAGATSVTITYSAADTSIKDGFFCEVSGLTNPVTDGINAISAQTGAGDSTDTGASVTTTATDGFIFGLIVTSNSITQNPKTGNEFTAGGDVQPTTGNAQCTLVSTTAATHTPVWLDNAGGATFGAATVAFKATAAAVGGAGAAVPVRAGRGPGAGPSMRRMAPQQFPTPGPVDTATPVPTSTPFRIGRAGTSGMPTRRMFPQQAPDTIPFVQDGSAVQTPFRIGRGGGIGAPTRRMFPQLYPDSSAITTTLAPSEGSIVIAGAAASITFVIAAIAGAIVIAGNAPSITTSLQATEGAIVISGNAASTTTILAASAGTVIIGGSAPSLSRTFAATDGAIVIGGNAPSIGAATFSPTEGAITIDGNAPSITLTIPAAPIAAPSGGYAGVRGAKLEWREWETLKKKRKEVERKAPQVARIIEEIAEQNFDLAPALKALSQQLDEENLRQAKIYRELMKLEIERNRFTAQLSEDDDEEAITLLLNG